MINFIVNKFPFLYTVANPPIGRGIRGGQIPLNKGGAGGCYSLLRKTFTKGGMVAMKNLILLVILSLFILPSVGLSGEKLQIENTQFDLKAASSCTGKTGIRGWTYKETGSAHGGLDTPVPFVDITWYREEYKARFETTTSNENGQYRFCDVANADYLLIAKKQGYDESKYRLTVRDNINYIPKGFSASFAMYKTGKSPVANCKIEGDIIDSDDGDDIYPGGIKIQILGIKNKQKEKYTTGDDGAFEFESLKPGNYRLVARKSTWKFTKKIKLEKNMTYFLYIDW